MTSVLPHPLLGPIKGVDITPLLTQFRGLQYAKVPRRFTRSILLENLPRLSQNPDQSFNATEHGPSCIQPFGSARMDAQSNQLPIDNIPEDEGDYQGEDCLHVEITAPRDAKPDSKLPVVLFLHGGAFFLGSNSRPYYSPVNFCTQALRSSRPLIFAAANYRLGALGFFHPPEAARLIPPNNGLHDQLRCFEWLRRNIAGFGGDPANITALGQSAGGESLSLHNLSGNPTPLYKRCIALSGSPVTMPCKTPQEQQENFIAQAVKLGVQTEGRSSEQIAEDMIAVDIGKIRDLSFVGAPCSSSEILPYDKPSMSLTRKTKPAEWLESLVVSAATYDGGISYNMMIKDDSRKGHAASFRRVASTLKEPQALLGLYDIQETDSDETALQKICQFESDIGFFAAALSQVMGAQEGPKTYFQLFDLGNPFKGPLEKGKFATHTWDVVALLGAYEDHLEPHAKKLVEDWRSRIIGFATQKESEAGPWQQWEAGNGRTFIIDNSRTEEVKRDQYLGVNDRRAKLLQIAENEGGEDGWDLL